MSVAKAGIICTLNARTAVLAAANPIDSKYNPRKSVVENIRLPPTILSRFDLIYLVLDKQSVIGDRRLATHIVSLYGENQDTEMQGQVYQHDSYVNWEFLSKYISYARKTMNPVITDLAGNEIVKAYKKMRGIGSAFKTITATPRQLESLIWLSEAHAKARLSQYVETPDVEEAERLIRVATHQAATDPLTGKIDMDIITSGMSAQVRETVKLLGNLIKQILRDLSE